MAPETTQIEHACGVSRINHQDLYPAQNHEVFTRLRHAALSRDVVDLRERPVSVDGTVLQEPGFRVESGISS